MAILLEKTKKKKGEKKAKKLKTKHHRGTAKLEA